MMTSVIVKATIDPIIPSYIYLSYKLENRTHIQYHYEKKYKSGLYAINRCHISDQNIYIWQHAQMDA